MDADLVLSKFQDESWCFNGLWYILSLTLKHQYDNANDNSQLSKVCSKCDWQLPCISKSRPCRAFSNASCAPSPEFFLKFPAQEYCIFGAFWHLIRQFTSPIAIRLKTCKIKPNRATSSPYLYEWESDKYCWQTHFSTF